MTLLRLFLVVLQLICKETEEAKRMCHAISEQDPDATARVRVC